MHWFDELAESVDAFLEGREGVVCNAGLSVSGLQHVGRLRGEIVLNHFLAERLREADRAVRQHLVLYTQDPWKGTEGQRARFPSGEGRQYAGWRLIDVPDPEGCHANWVDHYWEAFGGSLDRFASGVAVSTTTELYRREDMQRWVRDLVGRAEEIRPVVNRYRPRNPHPEGWLPFDPYCPTCRRIGHARALRVEGEEVAFACECGERGSSSLELGKLNWRLEWPVLWAILQVDVEPFGKDHAAPGGSRESCQVIAESVLGIRPPFGIPYEWVGYAVGGEDRGDMASSDFLGFGPREWLDVADPEVLRFLFARTPEKRRLVLDLGRVDAYHDDYDRACAAYYAADGGDEPRTYALSQLSAPPPEAPQRLPYRHASLLVQVAPSEDPLPWVLRRLRDTGMLEGDPSPTDQEGMARRLRQADAWVRSHAPPDLRVNLQAELPPQVEALEAAQRRALGLLEECLQPVRWREDAIKEAMVQLTRGGDLPVSTRRFFVALYTALLGVPSGPRAAPLLSVLDREFVLRRLREAAA